MILDGVRVLDFGSALAAPYAAMLLADLGAEVTKVEKPLRGDLIRFTDKYLDGKSGYFAGINRGKTSVTLDLRKERGQSLARELCRGADVLIENFRPGTMAGWGLSYEAVRNIQPDIIYCSVSAFGEVAGFETSAGNDIIAQAYSGIMAMTGEAGRAPAKAGAPVVDTTTACMATVAILAAIIRRQQTGQGANVRTSLIESAFAIMPNYTASVLNGEPEFRRMGSAHPQLAPYEAFPTADGKYVVVGAFHRESWRRLCSAMDREDLLCDERFAENDDRVENRVALRAIVGGELVQKDLDVWLELFARENVPASPVLEIEEAIDFFVSRDPNLASAGIESYAGSLTMLRAPFAIDGERPCHRRGAPPLGDSTEDVLRSMGASSVEIEELKRDRII